MVGFGLGALFVAGHLYNREESIGGTVFLVIWLVFACFAIVEIAKMPTNIQLDEGSRELIFSNKLISRKRAVDDLRMIKPAFFGNAMYFHFDNSKQITMARDWENLQELIVWLKENGANVRTKGGFWKV